MLRIELLVSNNKNFDYSYKQVTFFKNSTRTINTDLSGHDDFVKNENLKATIKEINYDNIDDLDLNEVKFIAKHKNIEFYWNKNKDTLIKDLKKSEEEISNG